MPRIAVVGAGTMGSGIAQVALQFGMTVMLYDSDEAARTRARDRIERGLQGAVERGKLTAQARVDARARLSIVDDLGGFGNASFVVEAIVEQLSAKRALFTALDEICSVATVLASNTSSLSITAIAAATRRPERVVGMHFFNPVPAMRLVEIIPGARSAASTVSEATELAQTLGKTPVLAKNRPGFIVNRIARPFYGEAIRLSDEGVATTETVDGLIKAMGFRMGPFELMDLVGLDVNLDVSTAVFEATFGDPRFRPHPLQVEMVAAGLLGRKSGKGFYEYPSE